MENTQENQADTTSISSENNTSATASAPQRLNSRPNILLVLLLLIFVSALTIGAYYLGIEKGSQKQSFSETPSPVPTQSVDSSTQLSPATLAVYQDPFIQELQFNYDPQIWTIVQKPDGEKVELQLKDSKSNGILKFSFTLPYGTGGAVSTFRDGELVVVDSHRDLYRYQTQTQEGGNIFYYGIDFPPSIGTSQTITQFDIHPGTKEKALEYCESDAEYVVYSPEDCEGIKSGLIKGYIQQPTFSWSFSLTTKRPLADINPFWATDEYIQSEGLDNGRVLVLISYEGTNVEEADKIVRQIQLPN